MAASTVRHVLITGHPGVGKTTLVKKVCDSLQEAGVPIQGFYTEEVRTGGQRSGFDIVTLTGQRGILSRICSDEPPHHSGREYRVGQYTVNLMSFEQTALPAIKPTGRGVLVIDEIGKMELFSQTFIQSVKSLLRNPESTILATIPVAKGKPIPFVEELRSRSDIKLFMVSKDNRDTLLKDITETVKLIFQPEYQSA